MKEETGFDFTVYEGGNPACRKPFYMGAGYTDEAASAVFGYVEADTLQKQELEDSETISVIIADKARAREILQNENVSLRCGYLLMNFINSNPDNPFAFLDI